MTANLYWALRQWMQRDSIPLNCVVTQNSTQQCSRSLCFLYSDLSTTVRLTQCSAYHLECSASIPGHKDSAALQNRLQLTLRTNHKQGFTFPDKHAGGLPTLDELKQYEAKAKTKTKTEHNGTLSINSCRANTNDTLTKATVVRFEQYHLITWNQRGKASPPGSPMKQHIPSGCPRASSLEVWRHALERNQKMMNVGVKITTGSVIQALTLSPT